MPCANPRTAEPALSTSCNPSSADWVDSDLMVRVNFRNPLENNNE